MLDLEKYYSSEDLLLADSVAEFANEKLKPIIPSSFEHASFSKDVVLEFGNQGLFGLSLPNPYGLGLSKVAYGLACQELEKVDSSFRSLLSVQNSLVMYPIYEFGDDRQRAKYLPSLGSGEMIGCFALTEHDHGSDPSSMKTHAKERNDGFLISGSKMWITNAPISDIIICYAKLGDSFRGFIVDTKTEGVTINEIKNKLSLRASVTGEIFFDNVFIPKENLLPGTDIGLVSALKCLTQARFGISFGAIGIAMRCYEIALEYSKTRIQFKKPIASFQLIQQDLVDCYQEIIKSQLLNMHVANSHDKKDWHLQVSLAKRNACRVARDVCRLTRNILGGNGIMEEYEIMRHLINVETIFTYEGSDNIHTLIQGKEITGYSAFT